MYLTFHFKVLTTKLMYQNTENRPKLMYQNTENRPIIYIWTNINRLV